MSFTEISKSIFVVLVLAVIVVVAVIPVVDDLGKPKAVAMENDALMLMEDDPSASFSIEVTSSEPYGVPRTVYSMTAGGDPVEVPMEGTDYLLWLSESFVLMATSSGILFADGSQEWLRNVGDSATVSEGMLSLSSGTTASFSSLAIPSESGPLALCVDGARVATFGSVSLFNLDGTATGTAGSVSGWDLVTEEGSGFVTIVSATDSDGVQAIGAVVPSTYYTEEKDEIMAVTMRALPALLIVLLVSYGAMAFYRRF